MLRGSEQLVAKVNCLEFENKGLMKALKADKKKKNKGKKNDSLQFFFYSRIQAACNFYI